MTGRIVVSRNGERVFTAGLPCPLGRMLDETFAELDRISIAVTGVDSPDLRLVIGDHVFAPVGIPHSLSSPEESGYTVFWDESQHFNLYAGRCRIRIERNNRQEPGEDPQVLLFDAYVKVIPTKVSRRQFDLILEQLQSMHRGLLLDVYGKAEAAVRAGAPVMFTPEVLLRKVAQMVSSLNALLPEIQRLPTGSDRESWEPARYTSSMPLDGEAFARLCQHPQYVCRVRGAGGRRVQPLMVTRRSLQVNLDTYEHRAINWYLGRMQQMIVQIRQLAQAEIRERKENRAWKDIPRPGEQSWWQAEDLPRIRQLESRVRLTHYLEESLQKLNSLSIVRQAGTFRPPLRLSPVFRSHSKYRQVFTVLRRLDLSSWIVLEPAPTSALRLKNLPELWEYWCTMRVIHMLSRRYRIDTQRRDWTSLIVDQDHFVIQVRKGLELFFHASTREVLRFVYQPEYWPRKGAEKSFGRISMGSTPYIPDMAIEVYSDPNRDIPEVIIILECKYRRALDGTALLEDIGKAREYRDSIGTFAHGGEPLVRHSWILYPSALKAQPREQFFGLPPGCRKRSLGALPMLPDSPHDELERVLEQILRIEGL